MFNYVPGEGPIPCRILILGEAPGRQEDAMKRPFVGLSGADLNRYLLQLCGLRRDEVYITNLCKVRPSEDNDDPTEEQIAQYEPDLWAELEAVNPKLIITVGAVPTRYFLGKDIKMEYVAALPHRSNKTSAIIFPLHHPASALHQADKFSKLVYNDFNRLGMYLRGELTRKEDDKSTYYDEVMGGRDIEWLGGYPHIVAIDTEGYPNKPWGLSYAGCSKYDFSIGGHATVVTAPLAHAVQKLVDNAEEIIFHNAPWDLQVLRAMRITIPSSKIRDSMIVANLLCVEPKKLKALAYREAGMDQEEYLDVIKDADEEIARTYLEKAYSFKCTECGGEGAIKVPWKRNPSRFKDEKCPSCRGDRTLFPRPEQELVFEDDFTARIYKPQGVGRRLKNILAGNGEYRAKWNGVSDSLRKIVEEKVGPIPESSLDDVKPRERVIRYASRDADATLRVYHALRPRITSMGLEEAYKIDLGCIPIIDRMHQNGILINKEYFYELDKKFEQEQFQVLDKLYGELRVYFNPSSPIQIKKELQKLGIKDLESTDEKTLKLLKIKAKDPKIDKVIDYGLDYRELNKLRGTYAGKLPKEADAFNRIHTTFILAGMETMEGQTADAPATGRLSSRDPNLQNIPTATERGNLIRAGFIAKSGCKLLSVDLSQIELRVGAHLAHEENMIEAFRSGLDLHQFTASKMFKVPYDQVHPKKQRYPAKTISFGIFYGMSKYRLQSELAVEGLVISLDEAQAFIDAWFDAYPGIKTYMHNVQAEARQNSFVRAMFGHIRYVPNVHCKDPRIREEALRQAGNHPVQSTAGEILKIGMANVHERVHPELNKMGYFEPLLTIHDELVFEVEDSITELAASMVGYEMENAVKLDVPLLSSYKIADNWAALK